MNEQTTSYLLEQLPKNSLWVNELESQAIREHIPIMDSVGMNFLMQLIRLHKPKKILEIGTAIGYSALRMVEANPESFVTTIEVDEERYKQALDNVRLYDKDNHINILYGDAVAEMEKLRMNNKNFDMVFIDAAKGQYKNYFNLADDLLVNNGVIIADNVLFRGYVSDESFNNKRYRNLVNKLREYNSWVMKHPSYHSSIVPVGDGVAISYKDSEES